jgi:hypothetical protein
MEKIKQTYVLPLFEKCHYPISSFDLWMSKGVHDVFALVIIFWDLIRSQNMLLLVYLKLLRNYRTSIGKKID